MKIKVIHIITDLDVGGAETVLYRLLSYMDQDTFEAQVISLTNIGSIGRKIQELGIPVQALGMHRGILAVQGIYQLFCVLLREKPNLVQTWMYHADLIGGVVAKLTKKSLIIWGVHATDVISSSNKRTTVWLINTCSWLSKWIPARIVCCAEESQRIHQKLGYPEHKMVVIPNGFDLTAFQPDSAARISIRHELQLLDDKILIGLVARFHPHKDHHNFIQAAAILYKDYPDVHFLLCGEGVTWENSELVGWIDANGMRDCFHLLENRSDISSLTASLDIATSSSFVEAFPLIVGEAMACGVPCVVTDVGDSAKIVGNTGCVVPARSPQALANGWGKLLQIDQQKRKELGQLARKRIQEKFSLQSIVNRYEEIYHQEVTSNSEQSVHHNLDKKVVTGFGEEWSTFDQAILSQEEQAKIFNSYFSMFPWKKLPSDAIGFDLGCGSGRWAKLVAPRVKQLYCIDPSEKALNVAKQNLTDHQNCQFHLASVSEIPLEDNSVDFGYSLGVLHHIPDTEAGIRSCVAKLKKNAPFLLYLYYRFDQRPQWFKTIWGMSDFVRRFVSLAPFPVRYTFSQVVAFCVYLPLAKSALVLEKLGVDVDSFPLSFYRKRSLYVMRTDALDRFGTRLEKRFTKEEIHQMMEAVGLKNIEFSELPPYWCAVGYKK